MSFLGNNKFRLPSPGPRRRACVAEATMASRKRDDPRYAVGFGEARALWRSWNDGAWPSTLLSRFRPWLLAFLSAILMSGSFPPWNIQFFAWIALLPILSCFIPLKPDQKCPFPFRIGCFCGFVFWLGTIHWIRHVSWLGVISLSGYLALYMGVWGYLITRLVAGWPQPKGHIHLLIACFGSASWVALEWGRGWLLGGFAWNFTAVSQYRNLPLIQIAEWTGVYGISFVIVFFNICLWLTWRRLKAESFSPRSWRYEFSAAMLLVVGCLTIGMRELLKGQRQMEPYPSLKLALIQPNIPQEVKYEPMSRTEQMAQLRQLTLSAYTTHPDLILWPETALVDGPSFDSTSQDWLENLMKEINTPLLFGTLDTSLSPSSSSGKGRWVRSYYNAAVLMQSDGSFAPPYHKLHLVPFGEYIPAERWIPWLRWFTPIPDGFESGKEAVLFEIKGAKLGPLICFEDTIPSLARNLSLKGATILVNLTNDAWFKDSPAATTHAANGLFRAIETRRPLVRCTNHGETLLIHPSGRVIQSIKPFESGFLYYPLEFNPAAAQTFFTLHGDWFPKVCAFLTLVLIIIAIGTKFKVTSF